MRSGDGVTCRYMRKLVAATSPFAESLFGDCPALCEVLVVRQHAVYTVPTGNFGGHPLSYALKEPSKTEMSRDPFLLHRLVKGFERLMPRGSLSGGLPKDSLRYARSWSSGQRARPQSSAMRGASRGCPGWAPWSTQHGTRCRQCLEWVPVNGKI